MFIPQIAIYSSILSHFSKSYCFRIKSLCKQVGNNCMKYKKLDSYTKYKHIDNTDV